MRPIPRLTYPGDHCVFTLATVPVNVGEPFFDLCKLDR